MLAAHPGRAYSRRQLLDRVWGPTRWRPADRRRPCPLAPLEDRAAARPPDPPDHRPRRWLPPRPAVNGALTRRQTAVDPASRRYDSYEREWMPPTSDRALVTRDPRRNHRVTIKDPKRLGALALLATIALGACSGGGATTAPSAEASSEAPSEAPASEPAATSPARSRSTARARSIPITEAVAEEFQTANAGRPGHVAFAGTGGGFKKFCTGETDINDASRPIKKPTTPARARRCASEQHRLRRAPGRDRRPDGRRQPGEHLGDLPDHRRSSRRSTGPDSPENLKWNDVDPRFPAEPVNRFMPGADSGHLRLLHRGRSTARSTRPLHTRPSPRTTTPW